MFACSSFGMVDFIKENGGTRKVWGTHDEFSVNNLYFYRTRMEWDHVLFGAQVNNCYREVTYTR